MLPIREHVLLRCSPETAVSDLFAQLQQRTDIPHLDSSDFYPWPRPGITLPMALHLLGKRARQSIHSRFLRSPALRVRVFDYQMCVPLLGLGIGQALARTGYRELDQRYVLQRLLKPGQVVLDLGANIGYYVAMYGPLLGETGKVYAVEPDPRSLTFLRKNIQLNKLSKIVTIDSTALSDRTGKAAFYQAEQPNLSGLSVSRMQRRYTNTISVAVQDFAEYLSRLDRKVSLLRMDIEGHEVEVLRSLARSLPASNTLAPQAILFEPHAWEYEGTDIESTLGDLFRRGYRAAFLCTAHEGFSPLLPLGYTPTTIIHSNDHLGGDYVHGVYEKVSNADAIEVIAHSPGITTVCLMR